ncbi:PGAP1-like protein-domain-containing protein [Chytriomyces sp. MP71]|nr:PGAP1-like protein-domain-containing protein [Chytriomyces sp. MP71]
MKTLVTATALALALLAAYAAYRHAYGLSSLHACRMTYMYPNYARIEEVPSRVSKYSLFEYREGHGLMQSQVKTKPHPAYSSMEKTAVPVLFLPGNAGAYKQARSLGSVANLYATERLGLHVYTVDTIDELAAFDARLLTEQAEFANDAVTAILKRHPNSRSVAIVAHSMGGIVAKLMLTMNNYNDASIDTILTLATPHQHPPVAIEPAMVSLYATLDRTFRTHFTPEDHRLPKHPDFPALLVVSLAAGERDSMVPSAFCQPAPGAIPPPHALAAYTAGVPGVWASADHRCVLWCNQLVHVLVRGLLGGVDAREPGAKVALESRREVWRNLIGYDFSEGVGEGAGAGTLNAAVAGVRKVVPVEISKDGSRVTLRRESPDGHALLHVLKMPVINLATQAKSVSASAAAQADNPKGFRLQVWVDGPGPQMHYDPVAAQLDVLVCTNELSSVTEADVEGCVALSPHLFKTLPRRVPSSTDGAVDEVVSVLDVALSKTVGGLDVKSVAIRVRRFSEGRVGIVHAEIVEDETVISKYMLTDMLLGLSFDVPSKSITTKIHLPLIRESFVAYNVHITSSCPAAYPPIVHVNVTGTPETKFLFPFPSGDVMPLTFHKDPSRRGLELRFIRDPGAACEAKTIMYRVAMRVDYLGTLGLLARRDLHVIVVLSGALMCSLFLRVVISREEMGFFDHLWNVFFSGLGALMVRHVAILGGVTDGSQSMFRSGVSTFYLYPVAYAVVVMVHYLAASLEAVWKTVAGLAVSKSLRTLTLNSTIYPAIVLSVTAVTHLLVSPTLIALFILLSHLHLSACVSLSKAGAKGSIAPLVIHVTIMLQILVTLLSGGRLVVFAKDVMAGWFPPLVSLTGVSLLQLLGSAGVPVFWMFAYLQAQGGGILGGREPVDPVAKSRVATISSGAIALVSVLCEGVRGTYVLGFCFVVVLLVAGADWTVSRKVLNGGLEVEEEKDKKE